MVELKNYSSALKKVTKTEPIILTKNGYGKYAIVDLDAYEEMKTELEKANAMLQYYRETSESLHRTMNGEKTYSHDEMKKKLGWTE
jgi:prevent-host-death family protein